MKDDLKQPHLWCKTYSSVLFSTCKLVGSTWVKLCFCRLRCFFWKCSFKLGYRNKSWIIYTAAEIDSTFKCKMKNMKIERVPLVLKLPDILGKVLFLNAVRNWWVGWPHGLRSQACPLWSRSCSHSDGCLNPVLFLIVGWPWSSHLTWLISLLARIHVPRAPSWGAVKINWNDVCSVMEWFAW